MSLSQKSIPKKYLPTYIHKKTNEVQQIICQKIASFTGIDVEDAGPSKQTSNDCEDCKYLVEEIKDKLKISNKNEKLQLLTLEPKSWSLEQTAKEFKVSIRQIRTARKLKNEKGILGIPEKNKGKSLSDEISMRVRQLYEDDEFSRMCPGQKDFVSVRIDGKKKRKKKSIVEQFKGNAFCIQK